MAKKQQVETPEVKASGSKLKWIILALILLLVLAAGGGAAYYFLVYKSADHAEEAGAGEAHAPEQAPPHEASPAVEKTPPVYHPLDPITVNLASPSPARFLKVNLSVVTTNPLVIAALDKHMPMIRNELLSMLTVQEFAVLNTSEGKQALRAQLKERVSELLKRVHEPSDVEDVLFTELVMQ